MPDVDCTPSFRALAHRDGDSSVKKAADEQLAAPRLASSQPEARVARGLWNIPYPADGEAIVPNVVIAPLVGFDFQCYRLGYGGGFFDRTLATLNPKPLAIGVDYPDAELHRIFPRPHDIPMDWVVTAAGTLSVNIQRPQSLGGTSL
jgi:5,10-methenyltetrahydrofolate synthetase